MLKSVNFIVKSWFKTVTGQHLLFILLFISWTVNKFLNCLSYCVSRVPMRSACECGENVHFSICQHFVCLVDLNCWTLICCFDFDLKDADSLNISLEWTYIYIGNYVYVLYNAVYTILVFIYIKYLYLCSEHVFVFNTCICICTFNCI